MDGAPFKVRTIYIDNKNDTNKEKPTLVLTHGNMAQSIGFFRLLKLLSEKYCVVAFDQMNLGLNTRSTDKSAHKSPETAELWIQEFLEKTMNSLDLPNKFYMAGHSFGGYLTMMYASMRPERIESIFLISPAGTHSYDPQTYNPYSYISLANSEKWDTKKEADAAIELRNTNQHALTLVHKQPNWLKSILLDLIVGSAKGMLRKGKYSEKLIKVFLKYYKAMLGRPGEGDITMQIPFKYPTTLIHSMMENDRLNNPKCCFPIAMAFGSRDMFASSNGAEDILINAKKLNGNRVNLFKINDGTHCFPQEFPEETAKIMIGHFSGDINGVWQPTIYGEHIRAKKQIQNTQIVPNK